MKVKCPEGRCGYEKEVDAVPFELDGYALDDGKEYIRCPCCGHAMIILEG